MAEQVKFIRRGGRIIPIKSGDMQKMKARAIEKGKAAALSQARDVYHGSLTEQQQQHVKTGFSVGKALATAGGTAAAGKLALEYADKGANEYARQAKSAKKKYSALGVAGVASIVAGAAVRKARLVGSVLMGGGAAAAAIGAYGRHSASVHQKRAEKIKNVTAKIKKYTSIVPEF